MLVTVKPSKNTSRVNDLMVVSEQKNKTFSKKLLIYFFIVEYCFLLDFGFFEPKTRLGRWIKKASLITFSIVYSGFLMNLIGIENEIQGHTVWWLIYSIESIIYITIVALSNISLKNLMKDLHIIDDQLGVDGRQYGIELKLITVTCLVYIIKMCLETLYRLSTSNVGHIKLFLECLAVLPYFSFDIALILFFFVFYLVYCRLKKFKEFILKNKSSIVLCEFIYKSLLDSTENAKKGLDRVFTVALLFNTPQMMVTIYETLLEFQSSQVSVDTYYSYATIMENLTLLFAPALAAGWLSSQVDKIKLILHDILIESSDPVYSQDIMRFLRYIDARPFKFKVYKIIPLDYTLPIIVLNICVTYLIVIIQLTHLY